MLNYIANTELIGGFEFTSIYGPLLPEHGLGTLRSPEDALRQWFAHNEDKHDLRGEIFIGETYDVRLLGRRKFTVKN